MSDLVTVSAGQMQHVAIDFRELSELKGKLVELASAVRSFSADEPFSIKLREVVASGVICEQFEYETLLVRYLSYYDPIQDSVVRRIEALVAYGVEK